jgi:hypothetical protein
MMVGEDDGDDDKTSSIKKNDNAWEEQRIMKMHYTAYSLLTYDNMDSRQTTMIWTDVEEQTMDRQRWYGRLNALGSNQSLSRLRPN